MPSTFLFHYQLRFCDPVYTSVNSCSSVLKVVAGINVWLKTVWDYLSRTGAFFANFYIKKEGDNVLIASVFKTKFCILLYFASAYRKSMDPFAKKLLPRKGRNSIPADREQKELTFPQ